jgi:hypothetical protein
MRFFVHDAVHLAEVRRLLDLEINLDTISTRLDLHSDEFCFGLVVLLIMIVWQIVIGHGGLLFLFQRDGRGERNQRDVRIERNDREDAVPPSAAGRQKNFPISRGRPPPRARQPGNGSSATDQESISLQPERSTLVQQQVPLHSHSLYDSLRAASATLLFAVHATAKSYSYWLSS